MWNLFTIKTLLDRAGLRTGGPSMGALLCGAWVSGTLGAWSSGDSLAHHQTLEIVRRATFNVVTFYG